MVRLVHFYDPHGGAFGRVGMPIPWLKVNRGNNDIVDKEKNLNVYLKPL